MRCPRSCTMIVAILIGVNAWLVCASETAIGRAHPIVAALVLVGVPPLTVRTFHIARFVRWMWNN